MKNKLIIAFGAIAVVILAVVLFIVLGKDNKFIAPTSSGATTYETITYEDYNTMIENKDNFLLFVYSQSCSSCAEFRPILNEVITDKELLVYAIENEVIPNDTIPSDYTPTFIIVKEGEIVSNINYFDDTNKFLSKSNFEKYLEKYISYETVFNVNTNNNILVIN